MIKAYNVRLRTNMNSYGKFFIYKEKGYILITKSSKYDIGKIYGCPIDCAEFDNDIAKEVKIESKLVLIQGLVVKCDILFDIAFYKQGWVNNYKIIDDYKSEIVTVRVNKNDEKIQILSHRTHGDKMYKIYAHPCREYERDGIQDIEVYMNGNIGDVSGITIFSNAQLLLKIGDKVIIKSIQECKDIKRINSWTPSIVYEYCEKVGIIIEIDQHMNMRVDTLNGTPFWWHQDMLIKI